MFITIASVHIVSPSARVSVSDTTWSLMLQTLLIFCPIFFYFYRLCDRTCKQEITNRIQSPLQRLRSFETFNLCSRLYHLSVLFFRDGGKSEYTRRKTFEEQERLTMRTLSYETQKPELVSVFFSGERHKALTACANRASSKLPPKRTTWVILTKEYLFHKPWQHQQPYPDNWRTTEV